MVQKFVGFIIIIQKFGKKNNMKKVILGIGFLAGGYLVIKLMMKKKESDVDVSQAVYVDKSLCIINPKTGECYEGQGTNAEILKKRERQYKYLKEVRENPNRFILDPSKFNFDKVKLNFGLSGIDNIGKPDMSKLPSFKGLDLGFPSHEEITKSINRIATGTPILPSGEYAV